ncbi:MAG: hypothetical protein ABIP30_01080 [Ferruginibacter sp.]
MKFLILSIIICFSFESTIYCQSNNKSKSKTKIKTEVSKTSSSIKPTEQETKAWIKNKIENFTSVYNESSVETHIGRYGTLKYELEFQDCLMIIRKKDLLYYKNVFTNEYIKYFYNKTYEIPLKEISEIQFSNNLNYTNMTFKIRSNENLIKEKTSSDMPVANQDEMVNLSNISIPSRLLDKELPSRITKAINYLMTLCGGKITKEVF